MADKHNIPKGKIHSNCRFLPDHIVCKITIRNNIKRANTCDPALKLLNGEIISDIQKHKPNLWKEHFDAHRNHRHNTHILLKTMHGLSNRAPQPTLNTSITFNNKIARTPNHIANCFTKQFTNTAKHATHNTNRSINKATLKIRGYNITLTTTQVQEAIKQNKNNNSQGPDKLNIKHLKHRSPLRLAFFTSMLKTALNPNIIPHIWKWANIAHIQKPNKDIDLIQAHIPPLNNCKDTGEEPSSLHNSKHTKHTQPTQVQNATLYSDGSTHNKQHRSKWVQPNGSPCANNHCSTRYEQSFRHNKHTYTYGEAATD